MFQRALAGNFGVSVLFFRNLQFLFLGTLVKEIWVLAHKLHQILFIDKVCVQSGVITRIEDLLQGRKTFLKLEVFLNFVVCEQELLDDYLSFVKKMVLKTLDMALEVIVNRKAIGVFDAIFQLFLR